MDYLVNCLSPSSSMFTFSTTEGSQSLNFSLISLLHSVHDLKKNIHSEVSISFVSYRIALRCFCCFFLATQREMYNIGRPIGNEIHKWLSCFRDTSIVACGLFVVQ